MNTSASPTEAENHRQALRVLNEAGIEFLVGGAYAMFHYTGSRRCTKDLDLFQFADTPEQAFELLRQGLTENYLAAEAATATHTESKKPVQDEDLMAGWNMDDFLSPELAKTRK